MSLGLAIVLVASTLLAPGTLFAVASTGATTVPPCAATSVRVSEYNTFTGLSHVNDLFWIRNLSDRACSLRGYVKVGFVTSTGLSLPIATSDSPGQDGNFVGGLQQGHTPPTVTLDAHGGLVSFWVDGLDIDDGVAQPACMDTTDMRVTLPLTSAPVRVQTHRGQGFFFCTSVLVLPVLPGDSGTLPSKRLSF